MKRIGLFVCTLLHLAAFSQDCQTFSTGCTPPDWFTGGGAQVQQYQNPVTNCTNNYGLQTPGVGGNNPARIILAKRTYSSTASNIRLSFDLFVFDANMRCASAKAFPCRTYIKVWLVKKSFTSASQEPKAADVYAAQELELIVANGNNSLIISGSAIPNGAEYRIVLDFKSPKNCVQGNTKYVLDNICTTATGCPTTGCAPFANDDFFSQGENFAGNTLKGNLYGGYALWAASAGSEYSTRSLNSAPAVNSGADGDADNTALNNVTFILVSGLSVTGATGCNGTPNAGTLVLNPNGTFTYTAGDKCVYRVQFTYRITDNNGQSSAAAKVVIEFPAPITLPVKFGAFTAQRRSATQVELRWSTVTEQANKGFYVQRKTSTAWENVALVFSAAADGNSGTALNYAYRDNNSNRGLSQYRLQQVDLDGKVSYSDVRTVQGEAVRLNVQVYPNPSQSGNATIAFDAAADREVVVLDAGGRIVRQQRTTAMTVMVDNLTDGFYSIRVTNRSTGEVSVEKLMVRKK